jgi:surface protein
MGTTYDANHVDAEYALVDNAPDYLGYLSLKKEPYAELAGGTLTFRYDGNRTARYYSRTFDLNKADESPAWHYHPSTGEDTGLVETVTAVVFDPSFAEARPTSCSGWFSGMTNLQSITGMKEYLNTNRVEYMAFMFANCSSLETLDLSAFYTNNVKTMYGMFRNCSALQTLDVTKLKTGRVESMFSMFEGCSSLTSLDVSRFNTRYVTSFESMFENCYSLKKLDLSAFDTHNVTNMMRMFIECQELSTIIVGDKWTMENVDMENSGSDLMFYDCYKLVGGAGTTYAEWRVDGRYAHIDGGDNDPGYFTAAFLKGDVNNDGQVGIGDIVAITNVMAGIETDTGTVSRADVNGDNQVGIGDIVAITNIMAGVQ